MGSSNLTPSSDWSVVIWEALIGQTPPWRRPRALDQKPTISWSGSCIWNQGKIGISFSFPSHSLSPSLFVTNRRKEIEVDFLVNLVGCPSLWWPGKVFGLILYGRPCLNFARKLHCEKYVIHEYNSVLCDKINKHATYWKLKKVVFLNPPPSSHFAIIRLI